ncbi:uncharacterized protein AMSG_10442 [Thecamonas trahens ATCC 50062]|uniref:Uncharacterized protein n=1 Tax=Thecamonas trahens ATCC 50062 TaxID=461836 RepID=A0A0L0DQ68_THETB|nr:hypothetical protein AMSG_10442 [Thecamonas trahens ATCC 50062]KNC54447.1 hypothetical protein AMSG_10442 [Thecamonas trahens ATCC 50062]|eukprot:XP_013753603.1 hypothetical protein AMSG_10442 [Thecamonas trahens ATCC 50062]
MSRKPKALILQSPELTRKFQAGDNVVYLYEGHYMQDHVRKSNLEERMAVPNYEHISKSPLNAIGVKYYCVVESVQRSNDQDWVAVLVVNDVTSKFFGYRFTVTHINSHYSVDSVILADLTLH